MNLSYCLLLYTDLLYYATFNDQFQLTKSQNTATEYDLIRESKIT